jgi:YD repeat-containing protein
MNSIEVRAGVLFRASSIVLFVVLATLGACDRSEDEPAPPVVCKLVRQTSNGTSQSLGVTTTFNRTFSHSYDAKGNKLSSSSEQKYEYSNGNKESNSSSTAFTYDDDGFLVRRVSQETRSNKDGLVSSQSTDSEYEYQTGRVSKANHTQTYNGTTITFTQLYEYDSEGRLIKFSAANNEYTKFEYAGNRVQKITYVDGAGNSRSPFIQYDADGRLVKSIDTRNTTTTEWRYEYNTSGDLVRYEQYINGKPSNAAAYEFDDKVNPNQVVQAPFKGHPEFPDIQAYPDYKHNTIKIIYYGGNDDKWAEGSTITNTYQYNANGVPIENISKSSDFGIQYASELTTYQYQDCN